MLVVSCDLTNGKPTNEKISESKLPDGWLVTMAWNAESGKFAAAYTMNDGTALLVGESLDNMQQLIGNLTTNSFVMTANDVLLMNGSRLISSAVFMQPKAELTIANFDVRNTDYTFDTGVVLHQAAWNVNIEDQMNTRSPDVDIFNITYSEIGSLIRKGFFVDLSGSTILMDRANNLYPAFRSAAITEDGKLIGLFTDPFFSNSLTINNRSAHEGAGALRRDDDAGDDSAALRDDSNAGGEGISLRPGLALLGAGYTPDGLSVLPAVGAGGHGACAVFQRADRAGEENHPR